MRPTLMLAAALFCRLLLNTARRFAYPFAPAIARGLDVPLHSITSLVAINQSTGIMGLFFGAVADRIGYRIMMGLGLFLLATGMLAAGLFPGYYTVFAGLFLASLAKNIFDPAIQAYVGERVDFKNRGRIIGLIELSWAGSTLVGIPIIGLMIEGLGWRHPFLIIGYAALFSIFIVMLTVTKEEAKEKNFFKADTRAILKQIATRPETLGALGFGFFISAANDNLFIIYGAWLEDSFGLGLVAIGFGTSIIGAAELAGEFSTALFSDRLGLKRAIAGGIILSSIAYILLPMTGMSTGSALGGLFLVFLSFEFTIVSSLSLCTELFPGGRATMMAAFLASCGMGRFFGAFMGVPVYNAGGILAAGLVSALLNSFGLVFILLGLRRWNR